MKHEPCETFAERLVDYADGELPAHEVDSIHEHLQACADCRETLQNLGQSLDLAKDIWSESESDLAEVRPSVGMPRRFILRRWPSAIAAGLLFVVGLAIYQRTRPAPGKSAPSPIVQGNSDQLQILISRAGLSAQLLVAADGLAECGGEQFARERWAYLAETYPETEAAAIARTKLKAHRSIQ